MENRNEQDMSRSNDNDNKNQAAGRWFPPLDEVPNQVSSPIHQYIQPPIMPVSGADLNTPLSVISLPTLDLEGYMTFQKAFIKDRMKYFIPLGIIFAVLVSFNLIMSSFGGYFISALLSSLILIFLLILSMALVWYGMKRLISKSFKVWKVCNYSDCVIKIYPDRIEDYTSNTICVMPLNSISFVLETPENLIIYENKINMAICYTAKYMTPLNTQRVKEILYSHIPRNIWHIKGQLRPQMYEPSAVPDIGNVNEVFWRCPESKGIHTKELEKQKKYIFSYGLILNIVFSVFSGIQNALDPGKTGSFILNFVLAAGSFFIQLSILLILISLILIMVYKKHRKNAGIKPQIALTEKGFLFGNSIVKSIIPWDKLKIWKAGRKTEIGVEIDSKPYSMLDFNLDKIADSDKFAEILKQKGFTSF